VIAIARGAWAYAVLALGFALLGLICFAWALIALVLSVTLPARTARKVGRLGAMWSFRGYLATMEAIGAFRLDFGDLDALRDAGPLIIAPNHPCLLDAPLIVSRLPNAVCVMKRVLLGNFLLGPAARLARYVRNDSLLRLLTHAGDELRQGGQLLLFPEATRSVADPIGPFTEAVGAISRRSGVAVQTVIIEAGSDFLAKGRSVVACPGLPLTYRLRLGRRFDPPQDVRAFTTELERYFTRELATRTAASAPESAAAGVDGARRVRG
jgi:1-acyl-sn-glycerol-3-phosphate acyltransferase